MRTIRLKIKTKVNNMVNRVKDRNLLRIVDNDNSSSCHRFQVVLGRIILKIKGLPS